MSDLAPPPAKKANPAVRAVVDYGGLVVFVAAYFLFGKDIIKATWGLMAGSAVSLLVGLVFERRVAPMPLFTGVAALLFGGLALFFHDARIVKMKPTAINLVLAAVMLGGAMMRRNPLKALLNDAVHMATPAWRTLTLRYGLMFLASAVINEVFWRTQPEAVWVTFHMPVLLALSVVFSLTQVPFLMKHAHEAPADEPAA
jgi:intracellular septation protein